MGGCWRLVFACCLLVQSLSAEDSVKGNSTSAVGDNSAPAVEKNSTSAVEKNSTSAVEKNSTSAVEKNSTPAVEKNSTSAVNPDEELEKTVKQRVASLRAMGQDEILKFVDIVLHHYNAEETSLFAPLKGANVTVKKAIGSMMQLRLTLEKTNCTKKDVNHDRHFRISRLRDSEKVEPVKYCGPLDGEDKEQLDCKFDIFQNERSFGEESVVSHDCKPIKVVDKEILQS